MSLPRRPSFGRLRVGKWRVWVTFFCQIGVHCAVPVVLGSQSFFGDSRDLGSDHGKG